MSADRATLSPLFTWRGAIADSNLPSTSRLVAFALGLHMNERGGSCFPSVATIGRETGLSTSTVREHLRELEAGGWLSCEVGGGRQSSRYTATIPTPPGGGGVTGGHPTDTRRAPHREPVPTPPGAGAEDVIERDTESVIQERAWSVDRKRVSDAEQIDAQLVLAAWNRETSQRLTAREWLAKIVMRLREHPELTPQDHEAIIYATLRGRQWWSGPPTPSIIYGNGAQFERSIEQARAGDTSGARGALDVAQDEMNRIARQREEHSDDSVNP